MLILGIESTCDETAAAVVKDGSEILSSVVSSQIDLHKPFGGVVPELACRRHIEVMIPIIDQALKEARIALHQIDVIAVACGPGLIGALLIGLNAAKTLSFTLQKPLIGVNHIEAHLYAAIMSKESPIPFPALGVVISGGHTTINIVRSLGDYVLVGQTVDDAVGEAFDKVAKILGLPYPGGPYVEALANLGDSTAYPYKAGKVKGKPYFFSYSGLKTAVLYSLKGQDGKISSLLSQDLPQKVKQDVAASFQKAALEDIVHKTRLAAQEFGCNHVILGGGVTNNHTLRAMFAKDAPELICHWPAQGLSLDNAAMIAGLGYHRYKAQGRSDPLDLDVQARGL